MRARHVLALVLASLATSVGCGGDSNDSSGDPGGEARSAGSKSPEQLLADTAAALRRVKSFHLEGKEGAGGKETSISGDIGLPQKLSMDITRGDAKASIIVVNGSMYIKANDVFWRQEESGKAARELAGRWLKTPASSGALRDLTRELDPKHLSRCLTREHGTLARGPDATVDGQQAFVLIDKGDRPGTSAGKLFVAATGEPLPLRAIVTRTERPGPPPDPDCDGDGSKARPGDEITFSKYDEPLNISAPPSAVDLTGGEAS